MRVSSKGCFPPLETILINNLFERWSSGLPVGSSPGGVRSFYFYQLIMAVRLRTVAADFHRTPAAQMVAARAKKQPAAPAASADPIEGIGNEEIGGGAHRFAHDYLQRIVRRTDQSVLSLGDAEPKFGGDFLQTGVEGIQTRFGGGFPPRDGPQYPMDQGSDLHYFCKRPVAGNGDRSGSLREDPGGLPPVHNQGTILFNSHIAPECEDD
jgi:hypothetical protein